jgi:hypothetical protein
VVSRTHHKLEPLAVDTVDEERGLEIGKGHHPSGVSGFGLLLDDLKSLLEHLHGQLRFGRAELPQIVSQSVVSVAR